MVEAKVVKFGPAIVNHVKTFCLKNNLSYAGDVEDHNKSTAEVSLILIYY